MSRPAWAAIIAAIAFPTIALVVVFVVGPRPPPGPPGGPPWGPEGAPPPPPLDEEGLVALRRELELTDEQVGRIRELGGPARERLGELHAEVRAAEAALFEALSAEPPDEARVRARLAAVHELRGQVAELSVLTSLRLGAVLTGEQRSRLVELWRERRGPPGHPGRHGPPPPFHHGAPGPGGPPPPPPLGGPGS